MNCSRFALETSRRKKQFFIGVLLAITVVVAALWLVPGWRCGLQTSEVGVTVCNKLPLSPGKDYIMQHLGHLWEQFGAREEIEKSLWLAVASSDETTPGSALIALSRGYQRDQQKKSLDKVRQQALVMAQNPATGLAVKVTALSIAGEGQGAAVKELANSLITDPATPTILRKVAERVLVP